MFDIAIAGGPEGADRAKAAPAAAEVLAFAGSLAGETNSLDDEGRIDLIRALEVLKCAAEGTQAVATADFDASMRAQAAARGVPRERQGRGAAHQVALARRESPHRGQRHAGLAKVLATEMPCTLAALRGGRITEWSATMLARETACLSLSDRRRIDRELAGNADAIEQMSSRELTGKARKRAAELHPESVVARKAKAEADRGVTIRPAPDTMTWLTGHLPVKQGVAVYAALRAEADRVVRVGDGRSRGQIMADTLVERVLGISEATLAPVTVNVVIGVDSLVGERNDAADVPSHGPIPAETVREWIREGLAADAKVELRRLFADPDTGQLVQMESKARAFPRPLADFIELRDQRCHTPWCDAPIRHADHVWLTTTADRPAPPTDRACASHATTRRKPSVGPHARVPDPATRSRPRHRPDTRTGPAHAH